MHAIVYGHPWDKSFNHAIMETVVEALRRRGAAYTLLDLYADGFNPAVSEADLALYSQGRTADALAMKYLDILEKTRKLIFIYPVWWGNEPAIIRGFYDKVLLKDHAWAYSPEGSLTPRLHVEKTLIFTTSDAPSAVFEEYFRHYLPAHIFDSVGISNSQWVNLDNITRKSREECGEFLRQAEKYVTDLA